MVHDYGLKGAGESVCVRDGVSAEEQEYTKLNNVMLYLLYEIFQFISRFS